MYYGRRKKDAAVKSQLILAAITTKYMYVVENSLLRRNKLGKSLHKDGMGQRKRKKKKEDEKKSDPS